MGMQGLIKQAMRFSASSEQRIRAWGRRCCSCLPTWYPGKKSQLHAAQQEADFHFSAPRKRIKCSLSSSRGCKICDNRVSSEADEITGLKEVSCGFRKIWMLKEKGPSGGRDGLKVTI